MSTTPNNRFETFPGENPFDETTARRRSLYLRGKRSQITKNSSHEFRLVCIMNDNELWPVHLACKQAHLWVTLASGEEQGNPAGGSLVKRLTAFPLPISRSLLRCSRLCSNESLLAGYCSPKMCLTNPAF